MDLSLSERDGKAGFADDALRMLRERGLLSLTSAGPGPSLVETVVGGPVRGSWSEHPSSKLIFEVIAEIEASPEVLVLRLVGGKVTFLHRALWPALVRIARDPGRVAEATARLSPCALRLVSDVEERGEVRLDELARQPSWPPERDLARAGKELETAFLVHGVSIHTGRGRQSISLRSWARAVPDSARREAAHLSLEMARDLLAERGAALFPARRERASRSGARPR